jgi:hypothetical protein
MWPRNPEATLWNAPRSWEKSTVTVTGLGGESADAPGEATDARIKQSPRTAAGRVLNAGSSRRMSRSSEPGYRWSQGDLAAKCVPPLAFRPLMPGANSWPNGGFDVTAGRDDEIVRLRIE